MVNPEGLEGWNGAPVGPQPGPAAGPKPDDSLQLDPALGGFVDGLCVVKNGLGGDAGDSGTRSGCCASGSGVDDGYCGGRLENPGLLGAGFVKDEGPLGYPLEGLEGGPVEGEPGWDGD